MSNFDNDEDDEVDVVDYTELVIKDMYDILTNQHNPWPDKYTKLQKLEFLDKMLAYLNDHQLYEMSKGIHKMKEGVKNERIIKNKKT